MNENKPTPDKESPKVSPAMFLKVIAKNFLSLPGIARDMNVARQNAQKLVTIMGGEKATGADAQFLKSSEREDKLEVETTKDKIEPTPVPEKEVKKPSLISKLKDKTIQKMKGFGGKALGAGKKVFSTIIETVTKIFNPKMFMSVIGRLAIPLLIVTTLWQGIKGAWDAYQETGSIWEAVKGGVGQIVDFFTFGFIDKKMVGEFMDQIPEFFAPMVEAASNFFNKIGEWFSEKFQSIRELFVGKKIEVVELKPQKFPGAEKTMEEQRKAAEEESRKRKEEDAKKKAESARVAKEKAERDEAITRAASQEEARRKAEAAKAAKEKAEAAKGKPTPAPAAPAPAAPAPAAPAPAAPAPAAPAPAAPTPSVKPEEKPKVSPDGKFSTKEEFIKGLSPYAEKVSQMIGGKVPPMAILGQWAGESGVGKSLPAAFNYAGIKAGKTFKKGDFVLTEERYTDKQIEQAQKSGESLERVLGPDDKMKKKGREVTVDEWYGKGTYQKTLDEGKKWVQIRSYFAAFDGLEDFANSFANFISSPRYAKAREQTTAKGFGFEIAKAGYATASAEKYSEKIGKFAEEAQAPKTSGSNIAGQSNEIAAGQRQQQKPKTPIVVNAPVSNETQIVRNEIAPQKRTDSSNLVLARVT